VRESEADGEQRDQKCDPGPAPIRHRHAASIAAVCRSRVF
jgi:hypothetical protein